jgi:hypothetical protein
MAAATVKLRIAFYETVLVSSQSYQLSGSTMERTADSTSNFMHEASWSSPPSIICYVLSKLQLSVVAVEYIDDFHI